MSSGLVAHSDLDERAIDALKEFNEDGALQVLVQFKESDLSHVQVSLIISHRVTGVFIQMFMEMLRMIKIKGDFICAVFPCKSR